MTLQLSNAWCRHLGHPARRPLHIPAHLASLRETLPLYQHIGCVSRTHEMRLSRGIRISTTRPRQRTQLPIRLSDGPAPSQYVAI